MFAFAIFHDIILTDQRCFGGETQSSVGDRQYIFLIKDKDSHIGCQTRFQLQVRIRSRDHYFISDYRAGTWTGAAATACISQTNLCHDSVKHIIRISIDSKAGALSFFNTAYICFIHVCYYLHLCQVGRNGEEGRSFESGSYGLSGFYIAADDNSVYRRSNRSIWQVTFCFCQRCLAAVESALGLLIIIESLLVVGIADQWLIVQSLATFVVLLLIFKFGFGTIVSCLLGCQFTL